MPGTHDRRIGPPVTVRPPRLQVVGADDVMPDRRAISVLYVEDDEDDVFLLRRQLGSLPSFDVDFAHAPSVDAARLMTGGRRFDVVLCDFWLGSETTIPLIDELRLASFSCPVVLVSSLENEDIELIGRRAGAAGFVGKADLTSAALDRIFATLLPSDAVEGAAPSGGVASWLRALMRGLDAAQKSGGQTAVDGDVGLVEALLADVVGSRSMRHEVIGMLAGLERATRLGAWSVSRFDAVPYLDDAVERLRARHGDEKLAYLSPAMPIILEASPTLFGDLIQGLFAEAAEGAVARVDVRLAVADGGLAVEVDCVPVASAARLDEGAGARKAEAAAEARRLLVETLAGAVGGTFEAESRPDCRVFRLSVPLRSRV